MWYYLTEREISTNRTDGFRDQTEWPQIYRHAGFIIRDKLRDLPAAWISAFEQHNQFSGIPVNMVKYITVSKKLATMQHVLRKQGGQERL